MTKKLLAVIILVLAVLVSIILIYPKQAGVLKQKLGSATRQVAALFFVDTITTDILQNKYAQTDYGKKIKILIAPGHEPNYGGAEYQNLKERDLALIIAKNLVDKLKSNNKYEVNVTRDDNGWNPELKNYFDSHKDEIIKWRNSQKELTKKLIINGKLNILQDNPTHGKAQTDPALRLYGINKWAGEKGFDIVLHLHLNNDKEHRQNKPGKYSGFAIYVPYEQYSNAKVAQNIASSIFEQLKTKYSVSNLAQEKGGIIEDQKLIALGRYNTSDTASILIEYGYIYEPKFADPSLRDKTLADLAEQTYLGLESYFK